MWQEVCMCLFCLSGMLIFVALFSGIAVERQKDVVRQRQFKKVRRQYGGNRR